MYELTSRIRDIINTPRNRERLTGHRGRWAQLCCSLDTVDDCAEAIRAFESWEHDGDVGMLYLGVYGVLQALFVQQDAVIHLSQALGAQVELADYAALKHIRDVRNAVAGHPTKRDRPPPTSYHSICRLSLSVTRFTLLSETDDGRAEISDLEFAELITQQNNCLTEVLRALIARLEEDEMVHKEHFRDQPLGECFPPTLGYCFEKLSALSGSHTDAVMASAALEAVADALETFRKRLEERGLTISTYDVVADIYAQLEHPLSELKAFAESVIGGEAPARDVRDAPIFARFVCDKLRELSQIAEEIDEEYSACC